MANPPLAQLLREVFPKAVFEENAADLQLGSFAEWDSLNHFNLLMSVEEAYGIRFSVEEMSELKSLKQIEQALKTKGALA